MLLFQIGIIALNFILPSHSQHVHWCDFDLWVLSVEFLKTDFQLSYTAIELIF